MTKLKDKVVFVTGGSRGMGAAIVRRMANEGARVAFTYHHSEEKAKTIMNEINSSGGMALAIAANNAVPEEIINAVNQTVQQFGGIEILVNNAGMYIGKPFEQHTLEDYELIMSVNVRAVFVASLAVAKQMKDGGRILTVGSNMADSALMPQATLYTMSKSALQGFTRGLSRDLGAKKINVNLIQPGPVNTDMNPDSTELADFLRSRMAIPEYGTGDDIAGLVLYLSSEEGRFITGSFISIDGGLNA